MTVGDVLETAAAVLGVAGTALVVGELVSWPVGVGSALLVAMILLCYLAQGWATVPVVNKQRQLQGESDRPSGRSDLW